MHSDDEIPLTLWQRWWLGNRRAKSTLLQYRAELDRLATHTGKPLVELDRLAVEDYILKRAGEGAATGRMAFRAVRSFYKWALERDVIEIDPTTAITSPEEHTNPTPPTATQEDVDRIIGAIDLSDDNGVRDAAFIAVLWSTGCRRGEVLRMETEHLDLVARTVEIPVTKTKTPRVVALTRHASERLAEWLEVRYSWKPTTPHVWLSRKGGPAMPWTSNGARLAFERRRHAVGLDDLTPHALRRGWATNALRRGVSQVSVERLGGWRAGSPMLARYTRGLAEDLALDEFRRAFGELA